MPQMLGLHDTSREASGESAVVGEGGGDGGNRVENHGLRGKVQGL